MFGKGAEVVQRLSECSEEGLPLADVLPHLFYLPIKHLNEYGRLLLKLATCYEVVGTYWKHWKTFISHPCFPVLVFLLSLHKSHFCLRVAEFCGLSEAAGCLLKVRVHGSSSEEEEEGSRVHAPLLEELSWEDDRESPCCCLCQLNAHHTARCSSS